MNPIARLLFVLLCLLGGWTYGQVPVCHTPAPSRAYSQALLDREKEYLRQRAGARLDEEITEVAVRVNVMLRSAGEMVFTKAEIDTCFAHLNRLFLPAGIRFHVDGDINYVRNDRWAGARESLEIEEMRQVYDVKHAVNLYFVTNYSGSSFAHFPTFYSPSSSNLVYIAASAFRPDVYTYLLPHEFGHYFGLFHTFAEGREQELVTRGPEANCETTGDWICDTPADPYPNGNCYWGADLVTGHCFSGCLGKDPRGDTFAPDITNLMSYYPPLSCEGDLHFTAGQYLRMKVGLQARLQENCFGNDRYSITGSLPGVYLSVDQLYIPNIDQGLSSALRACRKATVLTSFSPIGEFQPGNEFKVAIHEVNVPFFRPFVEIPAVVVEGKPNTLAFSIPDGVNINSPYYFQVRSTKPYSGCFSEKMLTVHDAQTVHLSFATTPAESLTVGFGDWVPLRVKTDGEGYLKATLQLNEQETAFFEGGVTSWKQVEVDYQAPFRFFKSSTIRFNELTVPCGYANSIGQLSVVVRPPLLKTQLPGGFVACAGQPFSIPYQSDVASELLIGDYQLQLSDETGQFADDSTRILAQTRTGAFQARLPDNLPAGTAYRTRIIIRTPQGRVAGDPSEPFAVRAKPQATLTAEPASIYVGDSTRLTIALTGEAPWSFTLSNGQSFSASQSPATVTVKPVETTDYRLTAVQNSCGAGTVSGLTTVTVLKPLSVNPVYTGKLQLRLWPNPVKNKVFVEWATQPGRVVQLVLVNQKGQVLRSQTVTGTGLPERTEFEVSTLPSGRFTIVANDGLSRQTAPFINP